ncbi:MAG: hypothetical protein H6538_04580 [Bacteroidales bacterium]|nr:hypothetical protein [Bacteroidales bacterium]MCB9000012.1 hypothetical protein [Bacteroidales bacterium]MCB9013258.1 hypothetical protein [Bacteroidales bacterium]
MNFLVLKLVLSFFLYAVHPVHVSVCNLELSEAEKSLSVKVFTNDFALCLKNTYQKEVEMEKADEVANASIISDYVNSCLIIEVNKSKKLRLIYQTSEINEDAIWFHFRVDGLEPAARSLKITNKLMFDLWDDQTNLLIINWKGKENGYRFNKYNPETSIELEN